MVLRMGRGCRPGTHFALVRIKNDWPDCFSLRDSEIFGNEPNSVLRSQWEDT